jgi:hypothetical protein
LAFAAPHHNPKLLPNLVTIWCRPPRRISDSLKNPLKDWISGDSMISCPLKKRSKKPKKIIDTPLGFWDIGGTHGNNQNKNMRTKTLLITAAALVAGIASSNAQVYSANVVGYAQVVLNGGFNLIANPFDDGNGNHLTNLVTIPLPSKSSVTTWNTGVQAFNAPITGSGGTWNADTILAPGTGFFIKNGTVASPLITNTFVGTVVAPVSAVSPIVLLQTVYSGRCSSSLRYCQFVHGHERESCRFWFGWQKFYHNMECWRSRLQCTSYVWNGDPDSRLVLVKVSLSKIFRLRQTGLKL